MLSTEFLSADGSYALLRSPNDDIMTTNDNNNTSSSMFPTDKQVNGTATTTRETKEI